jgi:hypothetical protein
MALKFNRLIKIIVLAAILLASTIPLILVQANIPVTADPFPATPSAISTTAKSSIETLSGFMAALKDGKAVLRGVYIPDVLAFRVVQQPKNQNGYVSAIQGVVTQFGMASDYSTIGLLAHNFAAGADFSKVPVGSMVNVIYGDGTIKVFKVTKIAQYQALQPNSASSNFLDLATNEKLSAGSLFKIMYGGKAHLTLQTCIAKGNESSWGRLFIIAEPVQ